MEGIDISPSITRMITESSRRLNPAMTPISVPTTPDTAATAKPTISDTRVPYITRE